MNQSFSSEDAYTDAAELSRVSLQTFHHQSMNSQKVFQFAGIQFIQEFVAFKGILHLKYVAGIADHSFPIHNIRDLVKGEIVILYS